MITAITSLGLEVIVKNPMSFTLPNGNNLLDNMSLQDRSKQDEVNFDLIGKYRLIDGTEFGLAK